MTVNYSVEYHRFWNDHAQFFPPFDGLRNTQSEPFKQFGQAVYSHLQKEMTELEKAKASAIENSEDFEMRLNNFIKAIKAVLDQKAGAKIKLMAIEKMLP